MIFSKPVHFYLNTKYPWVTAANSKNSTGDFRRVALKIVVLFTLFSLKVVSTSEMGAKMTKVMAKSTLDKSDWAVRYLPYRVLKQICTKLNIRSQFFDDFRMVAEQFGMDKDTIECIGQSENPTYKIFTSCHRDAKVGRLIQILHEIGRVDVAKVLEDWVAEP
ncbi:PREDICTED: uncharacterized protein LOC107343860 isoform X2 [Acropora digitifera]|uniref:uncharacterized protein LOC107343860 isoform X2 n=1 Tax=Acropora digitifera TaxID=70779 RepID=UPI00077A686D|nr:PREDICTED: uncharacterized protein LOC107343860 isoform X2 [Acropora digitifera]